MTTEPRVLPSDRRARHLAIRLLRLSPTEGLYTTFSLASPACTGARTAVVATRPCRAPHHTISDAGLIGGGHVPMPGEVSLAHHGMLFLDALPECRRHVLEVLRHPHEESLICIPSPERPHAQ